MKIQTISGVEALVWMRDYLKQQMLDIMSPAEAALSLAKNQYHQAKINCNQLQKRIDQLSNTITMEMQIQYDQQMQLEKDYQFKSHSQILLNTEDDLPK